MEKFLITGVAGFVGKYFVEYLQNQGKTVDILGVDIIDHCDLPITYQQIDLSDKAAVMKIINDFVPDYIVHLASISSVGQSWQIPAECFRNNTEIMLNILESVRQQEHKIRILSIGSSEEYGEGALPFKEEMALNPQNPYAVAKTSQEMLCRLYAKGFGVDVVMTRSFNHIGPRQSDRFVIPSFMKQLIKISQGAENKMLVGNILVARDFLDVRDVVAAYDTLLHKGKNGEVYNVCSGRSYKLRDIISQAESILGITANIVVDENLLRPNDVPLIWGDNSKLAQLGWSPNYSMSDTIHDIIERIRTDD